MLQLNHVHAYRAWAELMVLARSVPLVLPQLLMVVLALLVESIRCW